MLASSTYAISGTLAGLAQKLEGIVENHHAAQNVDTALGLELLGIADNYEGYDELYGGWIRFDEAKVRGFGWGRWRNRANNKI